MEFREVPDEVEELQETGIFDSMRYTHATSHLTREGVQRTGKIMAPRIAMSHDIVPFSGEDLWGTYLFRAYHVSVSSYPIAIDGHNWKRYIHYGMRGWTPERSNGFITFLKEKIEEMKETMNLAIFLDPQVKATAIAQMEGCIEVEEARQKKYGELSNAEKNEIQHPQPEIYVFGSSLQKKVSGRTLFGKPMQQRPHPFAPAEIRLEKHLVGMFTSLDVHKTRAWVAGVVKRIIPVGSLDALATYEKSDSTFKNQ